MKKKDISGLYALGQMIQLEFIKSDKSKELIARTKEGVICFLDRKANIVVREHSTWDCRVKLINTGNLIVNPEVLVYTPVQNEQLAAAKARALFNVKEKRQRIRKPVASYPFLRSTDKK